MGAAVSVAAGLVVLVVFLTVVWLSATGRLDSWPQRITAAVLGGAAVLIFTGAITLWAVLLT